MQRETTQVDPSTIKQVINSFDIWGAKMYAALKETKES